MLVVPGGLELLGKGSPGLVQLALVGHLEEGKAAGVSKRDKHEVTSEGEEGEDGEGEGKEKKEG